jgi:hypothetical protein
MNKKEEDSLARHLKMERARYLDKCKEDGGTAVGFRNHVMKIDKGRIDKWATEALMEAATRAWQSQPRKFGPDLFSINGIVVAEILTRPANPFITGEELDDEEAFEKVNSQHATVDDLHHDGLIKMRKAAQSSAAANEIMESADEALRRAKGNRKMFLRDLSDQALGEKSA